MGEANCRWAMAALLVGLLVAGAEDEPPVQVYPSNGGQLCASECSTCPLVCSSPPSPPSLPSSPDFNYATPPMPLLPPPPPPPPPPPSSPLSYIYPETPSILLPPPSPNQSSIYPYPYYFFYSGASAATLASTGLGVLTVFSFSAIRFVF